MTTETAELRKIAQEVMSNGITFSRGKNIRRLLKEAKVMAIISLVKKNKG